MRTPTHFCKRLQCYMTSNKHALKSIMKLVMAEFKYLIVLVLFFLVSRVLCFRCDRRPYGSTAAASEPDGRFKLEVLGSENDAYIPEQLYIVKISVTDSESSFTGFMISAEGDTKLDPINPRRVITQYPGELRPQNTNTAKFSDRCLYSVEHAMNSYKTYVDVYWQAPPSGNGCVTLRGVVVENDAVWFEDGAPLTKRLCEDLRQPDDVAPLVNDKCSICDEAKYELTFTGVWSRNTHPRLYPENDWIPRYSDLVGASHSQHYELWAPGTLSSDGFRDLAEHANSSSLEAEIRGKIGNGVRTVIKGKGHGYRKMSIPTYSFFRVDQNNHLFSAVVALHPSPDWYLGVTRFELCQEDNTWLQERELNLFPWDAGTDSGVSYESPNMETYPKDAVSRVDMSSYDKNSPFYEMDIKDMHPFGKLHIKLVRTYQRKCREDSTTPVPEETTTTEAGTSTTLSPDETTTLEAGDETPEEKDSGEQLAQPNAPSRYQTELASGGDGGMAPLATDPEPEEYCEMSPWMDWSLCEGPCEDGVVRGYMWRQRYHLIDGVAVEKYDPHARRGHKKEVSKYCKLKYNVFDQSACEEDCDDSDDEQHLTVERRVMSPIAPGGAWKSKRRVRKATNKNIF